MRTVGEHQLFVVLTHPITNSIHSKYRAIMQDKRTEVNLDKQRDCEFESLLSKVIEKCGNLSANTVVNKDTFGLDVVTWQKARQELEKRGIVRCEKKKTYVNSNLADIAREKIGE